MAQQAEFKPIDFDNCPNCESLAREVAELRARLTWTKEPPKVPGLYILNKEGYDTYEGYHVAQSCIDEGYYEDEEFTSYRFLGPLPEVKE